MRGSLIGLFVSALIHIGLFLWFIDDKSKNLIPQKIEKSIPLHLAMFQEQTLVLKQKTKPQLKPQLKPKPKLKPKSKITHKVKREDTKKTKKKTPAKKLQKEVLVEEKVKKTLIEKPTNKIQIKTNNNPTIEQQYKIKLRQLIASQKKYPARARRNGDEGAVQLSFFINSSGLIMDIIIKRSSGSNSLDTNAIATLEKVSGKLPFPAELHREQLKLSLSLVYQLH